MFAHWVNGSREWLQKLASDEHLEVTDLLGRCILLGHHKGVTIHQNFLIILNNTHLIDICQEQLLSSHFIHMFWLGNNEFELGLQSKIPPRDGQMMVTHFT